MFTGLHLENLYGHVSQKLYKFFQTLFCLKVGYPKFMSLSSSQIAMFDGKNPIFTYPYWSYCWLIYLLYILFYPILLYSWFSHYPLKKIPSIPIITINPHDMFIDFPIQSPSCSRFSPSLGETWRNVTRPMGRKGASLLAVLAAGAGIHWGWSARMGMGGGFEHHPTVGLMEI